MYFDKICYGGVRHKIIFVFYRKWKQKSISVMRYTSFFYFESSTVVVAAVFYAYKNTVYNLTHTHTHYTMKESFIPGKRIIMQILEKEINSQVYYSIEIAFSQSLKFNKLIN